DSFGTGIWFEAARYKNKMEKNGNCGYAEYTPKGDGMGVKNYDVAFGKKRLIEGSAKLAADAGKTGKMIFSYPYGG
ncbi:jg1270, partial [Pararge aegeria aegeria]